jgi:glycine/D-amino acid oxidase-like deaminating enzyme
VVVGLVADRAVVAGASMAGLCAARVLADRFGEVVLMERDELPAGAQPRRGVPQGRHTHALLTGGGQRLERWFPGLGAELLETGALPFDRGVQVRWFQAGGLRLNPGGGRPGSSARGRCWSTMCGAGSWPSPTCPCAGGP